MNLIQQMNKIRETADWRMSVLVEQELWLRDDRPKTPEYKKVKIPVSVGWYLFTRKVKGLLP